MIEMEKEPHDGGYDLKAYLQYNRDIYTEDDIKDVPAQVPGHNDENAWFWVIELNDGRFVLTCASCDFTGWDCQSWGQSYTYSTALEAAEAAPDHEDGRQIRRNLVGQIKGEVPYGLEFYT